MSDDLFVIIRPDGSVSEQVFVPQGSSPSQLGQLLEGQTQYKVSRFGEPWEDFVPGTGWVPNMPMLKATKWEQVKAQREAQRLAITTSFGVFNADETAKTNLLGKLKSFDILGAASPAQIVWKLYDNSFAVLDRADFEAACLQILAGIEAIYEVSFAMEVAINAATSPAELDAIDVEAGWPN